MFRRWGSVGSDFPEVKVFNCGKINRHYTETSSHLETRAYVSQSLFRHSEHVDWVHLHRLEADHVNEALVEVGDVLLAPGHVLQSQPSGDVLGLVVTGRVLETPGQGAVTLLHPEADHGCLVGGGVHVEHSRAAVGELNIRQSGLQVIIFQKFTFNEPKSKDDGNRDTRLMPWGLFSTTSKSLVAFSLLGSRILLWILWKHFCSFLAFSVRAWLQSPVLSSLEKKLFCPSKLETAWRHDGQILIF